MNKKLIAIALSTLITTGCSSIVSKSDYAVAISSAPEGASFVVTNKSGQTVESGVTPSTVTLSSSAGYFDGEIYTISLKKEGFDDKTFELKSTVDGWYFGNILIGGLIGMLIVDPMTGAMYNLPPRVDISLTQSVADNKQITIMTIDALDEEQKSRLERI